MTTKDTEIIAHNYTARK